MNNKIRIVFTEREVQELSNGHYIYLSLDIGGELTTLEIYQGDEEENE